MVVHKPAYEKNGDSLDVGFDGIASFAARRNNLTGKMLFVSGRGNFFTNHLSGHISSRPKTRVFHTKWWFSKGNPCISGKPRLVKYHDLTRSIPYITHALRVCA